MKLVARPFGPEEGIARSTPGPAMQRGRWWDRFSTALLLNVVLRNPDSSVGQMSIFHSPISIARFYINVRN
jgi:hypothetical protein